MSCRRRWPYSVFPNEIRVDGERYRKAIFRQGYPGVVEQYRAVKPFNSGHLFVYEDHTFDVDHVDRYNPDLGYPVEHFFADHPVGRAIDTALTVAGMLDDKFDVDLVDNPVGQAIGTAVKAARVVLAVADILDQTTPSRDRERRRHRKLQQPRRLQQPQRLQQRRSRLHRHK